MRCSVDYLTKFLDFNKENNKKEVMKNDYSLALVCRELFYNLYIKEEISSFSQIFKSILTDKNILGVYCFFKNKFIEEGKTYIDTDANIKYFSIFNNIFDMLLSYFYEKKIDSEQFQKKLTEMINNDCNFEIIEIFLQSFVRNIYVKKDFKYFSGAVMKTLTNLSKNGEKYVRLIKEKFVDFYLGRYNEILRFVTKDLRISDFFFKEENDDGNGLNNGNMNIGNIEGSRKNKEAYSNLKEALTIINHLRSVLKKNESKAEESESEGEGDNNNRNTNSNGLEKIYLYLEKFAKKNSLDMWKEIEIEIEKPIKEENAKVKLTEKSGSGVKLGKRDKRCNSSKTADIKDNKNLVTKTKVINDNKNVNGDSNNLLGKKKQRNAPKNRQLENKSEEDHVDVDVDNKNEVKEINRKIDFSQTSPKKTRKHLISENKMKVTKDNKTRKNLIRKTDQISESIEINDISQINSKQVASEIDLSPCEQLNKTNLIKLITDNDNEDEDELITIPEANSKGLESDNKSHTFVQSQSPVRSSPRKIKHNESSPKSTPISSPNKITPKSSPNKSTPKKKQISFDLPDEVEGDHNTRNLRISTDTKFPKKTDSDNKSLESKTESDSKVVKSNLSPSKQLQKLNTDSPRTPPESQKKDKSTRISRNNSNRSNSPIRNNKTQSAEMVLSSKFDMSPNLNKEEEKVKTPTKFKLNSNNNLTNPIPSNEFLGKKRKNGVVFGTSMSHIQEFNPKTPVKSSLSRNNNMIPTSSYKKLTNISSIIKKESLQNYKTSNLNNSYLNTSNEVKNKQPLQTRKTALTTITPFNSSVKLNTSTNNISDRTMSANTNAYTKANTIENSKLISNPAIKKKISPIKSTLNIVDSKSVKLKVLPSKIQSTNNIPKVSKPLPSTMTSRRNKFDISHSRVKLNNANKKK